MSFTTHARDEQRKFACPPSLLAMSIAFALAPAASFAATNTEETVVVEGNALQTDTSQDQDYSVKTTTTGTKLLLVPRVIPLSVSLISLQCMQD